MENRYDLVVVGAGILGVFHAFHASKLGKRVLLLERNSKPFQATVRNFGQVVPSGLAPGRWRNYGKKSLEFYNKLQEKADFSIRAFGSLYVASNSQELGIIEEMQQINDLDGYESHIWTKQQCLDYNPNLNKDYCKGGLYFPNDLSADPRKLVFKVIDYLCENYKLDYRSNCQVHHIEDNDDHVVIKTSANESFKANYSIFCGGHEFKTLFPNEFEDSKIEVTKLNMMVTEPLSSVKIKGNLLTGLTIRRYEAFQSCPSFNDLVADSYLSELQSKGIHLLFKQSDDGSIIIGDSHDYSPYNLQEALGFGIDMKINRMMLKEAARILDLPKFNINETWSGIYSQCKEGLFDKCIGNNIRIITAIGGKGMTASGGLAHETIENLYK